MELRKITILDEQMPECIALEVAPEQKDAYNSFALTLAYAYDHNAKGRIQECRAVYAEGKMVGLIRYDYYKDSAVYKETCYYVRPVMIDKNYLGRGYEKMATAELLEEIKSKPFGEATALFASHRPCQTQAERAQIYKELGFELTDLNYKEEDPDDEYLIVRLGI